MRKSHMMVACAALTFLGALGGTMVSTPLQALELPAPELMFVFPADQQQIAAPLSEISLMFTAPVDLVSVAIITPDQQRIVLHDAFNGSEEKKGDSFTLSLPQPLTMPGTYLIDYSASVTDPSDRSASSTSSYSGFIITEGVAESGE
ncbi:copper resistance protein CopC [Blastomonas sp. SL216]|uniref:copper resistance protein CopC n=1 Tax=Blastomonas sp. SL216 TaxID=2995169 RepID=UPI002377481F|nr:copper resistance protein CopC [Blastomonas sp. SL216]